MSELILSAPVDALTTEPSIMTAGETDALLAQEARIGQSLLSAFDVGDALTIIRDSRLYRQDHTTFEEYVAHRWDMSRSFAYSLIDAASVIKNLKLKFNVLPTNEFQARPLAKLDSEQQQDAWTNILTIAKDGPITNKVVKSVVADMIQSTKIGATPPPIETESASLDLDYRLGDPLDLLGGIPTGSADLLLISELPGSTPAAAAKNVIALLSAALPAMKSDHQLLVFSTMTDPRTILNAAEQAGYEVGVTFRWVSNTSRSPVAWSAKCTEQSILHFRQGKASLATQITNVIECDEESFKHHATQKPVALIRTLIEAATKPGDSIINLGAGAATANIACMQLGRSCVGIEASASLHKAGLERIAEYRKTSDETTINE